MLSAIPAFCLQSDSMFGNPFPPFENGFLPLSESELFIIPSSPPSPKPIGSSSGSGEPDRSDQNQANSNNSGSDEPKPPVQVLDERKRRRMISNRESASWSRMQKQKHFENGFLPSSESELIILSSPPSPKPVGSSPGSGEPDRSDQNHANSNNSGDDDRNQGNSNNSGSDEPKRPVQVIDERKRRRMISNRESARRSRMRKQKHLENLRNQLNRLRIENRELTNRLRFIIYHCHRVRTDNDRLRYEHSMLRRKLSNIRQILMFRQLQQDYAATSA